MFANKTALNVINYSWKSDISEKGNILQFCLTLNIIYIIIEKFNTH